jgi:hypothetical protein
MSTRASPKAFSGFMLGVSTFFFVLAAFVVERRSHDNFQRLQQIFRVFEIDVLQRMARRLLAIGDRT